MAAQPVIENHQYLSVSNYLENGDSDSSAESEPHDRFDRLRARLSSHPRAGQRLVIASAVLGVLVLVLATVGYIAGRSDGATSSLAPTANAKLRAVQLEAVNESARSFLKPAELEKTSEADRVSALFVSKPAELLPEGYDACDANEELYGGLCYKKCSVLTQGEAPIRTSSWTCCESHPCGLSNQRGGIVGHIVCNGFDVSGADGCPHKPGACMLDEEMHLGMCYKKCSLLTGGKFAHRVAAATCCKTTGIGCMNILNDKTSEDFNVGGGEGDHDPSTPSRAHPPMQSLPEVAPSSENIQGTDSVTTTLLSSQPPEHLPDGQICGDNEELYGGLCYKTCSSLTSGEAPIRTSSWTCCKAHPCSLFNQHGSVGTTVVCNGFDVSADSNCPHKPGACLADEELHLGVCFKKCEILTDGEYPHRFAAATCCKAAHGLGCLNPRNDLTRSAFAVGGGSGDHKISTPNEALMPDESLNEETTGAEVTALTSI